MTSVAVTDPTAGCGHLPGHDAGAGCVDHLHAPAAHTIMQADVDAGVVSNTATATAKNPADATVTSNSSHTDTPVSRTSNLKLVKTATVTDVNGDCKTDLGDTIAWSFQVTNTGTTTITDVRGHRPQGRRDHLPDHHPGARRHDHVHGDAAPDHPGRRRRRGRQQHGHRARRPMSAVCR